MKNKKEEQTDIELLLEELRKSLLKASVSFEIWSQLWPTEEVVHTLNAYKGFFLPTIDAHLSNFIIKVCIVLDKKDKRQPSFFRILQMIEDDGGLNNLDIPSVRRRLVDQEVFIENIKKNRDKRVAHHDTLFNEPMPKILYGNCQRLLKELQDIFNEIYHAYTVKEYWEFKYMQCDDTKRMLNKLKKTK